ncbi:MAG: hypothetical protein D6732_06765 [Methanobacteriota archaeon]|nr:MAG: hypothetical protein D6732_06765 [Euryarchaeota archaeon]
MAEYDFTDGETLTPTLTSHYTYGNGRIILMERTPAGEPVESYWYHYDGLGSVVALTDESGAETCQWQYDEYGNPLRDCPDLNHYTYTGQEYDAETGLTHFYARYYDAKTGVWVSQDVDRGSARNPITIHRYLYVGNNPINLPDLLGYGWWEDRWNDAKKAAGFVGDVAVGVGEGVVDTVKGLVSLAAGIGKSTIIYAAIDEDGFMEQWDTNIAIYETIKSDPGSIVDAVVKPYKEDWENGHPGRSIGRGIWEIGSLFISWEKIGKLSKLSKLDDLGNIANKLDDLGNVANKLDDVGNVANKLDDVGNVANKLDDVGNKLDDVSNIADNVAAVGQRHHLLSKKIMNALDNHPTLKNIFKREDPRFIYNAADDAAHRGYQTWHRQYDSMVVDWLEKHPSATPDDFTRYLHDLHQQPWLQERIPNVKLIDD